MPDVVATTLEPAPVPLTVLAPEVSADELLLAADSTQQLLTAIVEEQDEGSVAVEDASTGREAEHLPLFYRYEIQPGDTVNGIGARFGIGADVILWNNIDIISDEDILVVGDQLQIPSVEGIIHSVRVGETLTEIANLYDARTEDILNFAANDLPDPNLLREGSVILVPGGRVVPVVSTTLRPEEDDDPQFVDRSPSDTGFIWPVVGILTSDFGPFHRLGIDISVSFVPVAASAPGQVVFAGGDVCCSYGRYIEVRHENGLSTIYAHLSEIAIGLGEWVEQGQIIATSGNSGSSTGPHVHYEIRLNGVHQNPLLYLP